MRELVLHNGERYFFTTTSCDIKNPLGVIKATLQEFTLYTSQETQVVTKLYKTHDGNWYDDSMTNQLSPSLVTLIKLALDELDASCTVPL